MLFLGGPLERLHVFVSRKSGGSGLVGGLDGAGGVLDVSLDGDGATAAGDLDHVVGVVRDGHEFGEGGVAEDAVVGQANVGDVEIDLLGVPKVTASFTCPRGEMDPLVTPVKGREGMSQS